MSVGPRASTLATGSSFEREESTVESEHKK